MANEIKLKRGSGSNPTASDLVVGEIAIRTDTGKLFTKKDDNSVAEISGGGISDGDKGDITVSNSGATFTIDNDVVTFAKMQNIGTDLIVGRASSGSGDPEALSAANVRSIINVEDGATADQSASEIVALIADQTIAPSTIDMEDDELIKIGTSDDLQLSHNGTHSKIINSTGTLLLQSDVFAVTNAAGNSNRITSPSSGSVRLFHSDSQKLETTSSGLDVTGNIVVSGTVDGRDLATDGSKLDGIASGATNVSTENIQDIVGGMVTGNTETGITVTYQDGDGTLDFVVGTLNQDTTGNAATATALETARNIGGVSFDGTGNINLPGVNTSGDQDTSGNAATATKLATARTIAGVSFDGSANISLNNNAITNGAGYITATLSNEQVQDIVGGMVSGNTESGITVTYQDSDGTLDFSVASQTDNNFTDADHSKLDGIASGATNVTNNNQLTNGAGYITATLTNEQVQDIVGAMVSGNTETGISVTYQDGDGTLDFAVSSQTDENFTTTLKNKLDGIAAGATNVTNNNQLTNGAGYITSASDNTKLPLSGGELTGDLITHEVRPDGNNTRSLGTSSKRWSNVFTNDLHLSNKGGSNKVDNTWGDFTIQEGIEDLFLINNRNGKMFKFVLKEVN